VSDPSGAIIPGATVTLTNKSTNQTQTASTNASGTYVFNALPPDHFSINVTAAGFKNKVLPDVQIIPEQPNTVNVELEVGAASQTVTVSGTQQPLLDTSTASVTGTISSDQIQHMPSFGRDPFQLIQLAPARQMPSSKQKMPRRLWPMARGTTPTASPLMASARPARSGEVPALSRQ